MTKILVCDPTYFGIEYQINPWMNVNNQADRPLAIQQWYNLVDLLKKLDTEIEIMPGVSGLPDLVFTANAGLVLPNKKFILSKFKYKERQPEEFYYRKWFENQGYDVFYASFSDPFEGAGDALFKNPGNNENSVLYLGSGFRSDISEIVNVSPVQKLRLCDPYFYHLDTCFCPLKDDFALIWPGAIHPEDVSTLSKSLKLLMVLEQDAKKFACNAICLGNQVLIPSGCDATIDLLTNAGFEAYHTDMSEFIKSGGACKCLTIKLN